MSFICERCGRQRAGTPSGPRGAVCPEGCERRAIDRNTGKPVPEGELCFYVDPEAGNDAYEGTRLRPMRTFRALAERLRQGPVDRSIRVTLLSSQPDDTDPVDVGVLGRLGVRSVEGDAPRPETWADAEKLPACFVPLARVFAGPADYVAPVIKRLRVRP